jgi:geranylgeranyl pyrophosphate synthase
MSREPSPALRALQARSNDVLVALLGRGHSEFAPDAGPGLVRLFEASAYALTRGGKRVRPMLAYTTAAAIDPGLLEEREDPGALDYVACAAEMMHAYSLVHDDLPAMDDDDMRRGQPTCHIAFDEATAILVGDGLQARALELLADAPDLAPETRVHLVQVLAAAAGLRGMVGGQAIDVAAVSQDMGVDQLETRHALKSGALIRASVAMGGIAAGASEEQLAALDDFADAIGLAFQICDDILDATGDSAALGKAAGADEAHDKPNYVSLVGLEAARARTDALLADAEAALEGFGEAAGLLRELARFIVHRDN